MAITDLPDDMLLPELTVDDEPLSLEQLDATLGDEPGNVFALVHGWRDDDPADFLPADVAVVHRFAITSDEMAEWAMAHVAAIDAAEQAHDERRDAMLARIKAWHAAQTRRLSIRRAFFEAHLVAYARTYRAQDPKRNRTLTLASGAVKSTERKAAPKVTDADALIAWAESIGAETLLRRSVEIDKREVPKVIRITDRAAGWLVTLECEHTYRVPTATDDGVPLEPPVAGEIAPCTVCGTDPITDEGEPRIVTAVTVVTEPVPLLVCPDCDGAGHVATAVGELPETLEPCTSCAGGGHYPQPPAGVAVEPTHVTFKVTPS